jgi:hypothetical protein
MEDFANSDDQRPTGFRWVRLPAQPAWNDRASTTFPEHVQFKVRSPLASYIATQQPLVNHEHVFGSILNGSIPFANIRAALLQIWLRLQIVHFLPEFRVECDNELYQVCGYEFLDEEKFRQMMIDNLKHVRTSLPPKKDFAFKRQDFPRLK